jgi:hypothetical protein
MGNSMNKHGPTSYLILHSVGPALNTKMMMMIYEYSKKDSLTHVILLSFVTHINLL